MSALLTTLGEEFIHERLAGGDVLAYEGLSSSHRLRRGRQTQLAVIETNEHGVACANAERPTVGSGNYHSTTRSHSGANRHGFHEAHLLSLVDKNGAIIDLYHGPPDKALSICRLAVRARSPLGAVVVSSD